MLLVLSAELFAQSGNVGVVDPYSTGMGKTYTAASRGIYAVGLNPANLALSDAGHMEMILPLPPNISARVGTNFISINEFNYFFGGVADSTGGKSGRVLTQEDKDRLVNLFNGGGKIVADINLLDFGFTYKPSDKFGAIGFTVQDYMSTMVAFPAGFVDLALSGNPLNKEYTFNDLDVKAWYVRSYNLSYARELKILPKIFQTFAVGFGVKYIQGFAYASIDKINTRFVTNADYSITEYGDLLANTAFSTDLGVKYSFDSTKGDAKFKVTPFPKNAGSGMGYDIGIAGVFNEKWSFGMAVTDIGSIDWKNNTAQFTANSEYTLTDISNQEQRDSLIKAARGDGKFSNGFTTKLPTAFRLGISWNAKPGVFLLSADLNSGLNDAPRNVKGTRFSIGGNLNATKWLPYMRGGFSFGGQEIFCWTVGIGFSWGPMEFNAATPDFQYIFMPKDGKRISFAGGWRLKLN